MSFTSDLSELSRKNLELDDQVTNLKSQIDRYETEIEQFEMLKSDWQIEKEALEDVLMQLREQMKEKENSLNVIEAQKVCIHFLHLMSFRTTVICSHICLCTLVTSIAGNMLTYKTAHFGCFLNTLLRHPTLSP